MKRIVADFETRSPVDIKICGAYKYAEHPDTDVTMLAVLDIDNPDDVRMWIGPKFRNLYQTEVEDEELANIVGNCNEFVAHNAPFERVIWKHIMCNRYGFKDIPIRKVVDTAAMCSMVGLPRNLEKASEFLNAEGYIKDMEGSKVMKRFIAPKLPVSAKRKCINPENPDFVKEMYEKSMSILKIGGIPDFEYHQYLDWYEDEGDFRIMVEYCRQDVRSEYYIYTNLPHFNEHEQNDVWVLDQEINDRGVPIDIKDARGVIRTVEEYSKRLQEEAVQLTNGDVTTMKSHLQIKKWLLKKGIEVDSVDKSSVSYLLTLDLPSDVRRFLEIRQTLGKSSVAKYQAMISCASNFDGRVRGVHAFYGAQTGRWAGRLLQTQNLPRPAGWANVIDPIPEEKEYHITEADVSLIASGNPDLPLMWFKDVNVLAADCIRAMIRGGQGKELVIADFSAVEARALSYLAGEESDLIAYRQGKDIYKVTAAMIYGITYEKVDGGGKGAQRQIGKTALLACGYSGGYSALCRFGYDKMPITEEDALHAIEVMEDTLRREDMEDVYRYLGIPSNLTGESLMEAVKAAYYNPEYRSVAEDILKEVKGKWIVKQWRSSHPKTVQFWYDMKNASLEAVENPGARVVCGKFVFKKIGRYLVMRLPSGRNLYYLDPEVEVLETPWGTKNKVVTSLSQDSVTKKMERRALNISILVENAVQAFCRDLLAESMLRLRDKLGVDIVMHIHDECVSEIDVDSVSIEDYISVMSETPEWAEGMPLIAAGDIAPMYHK